MMENMLYHVMNDAHRLQARRGVKISDFGLSAV